MVGSIASSAPRPGGYRIRTLNAPASPGRASAAVACPDYPLERRAPRSGTPRERIHRPGGHHRHGGECHGVPYGAATDSKTPKLTEYAGVIGVRLDMSAVHPSSLGRQL